MARARPHLALVQLDVKNAFGSVDRTDALDIVSRRVPGLAKLLAAQWRDQPQRMYAEEAPGVWACIPITAGMLQGGQDGAPVFCLVLAAALERVHSAD
eukprot:12743692-Heterocapsa_arctica.AAC.1